MATELGLPCVHNTLKGLSGLKRVSYSSKRFMSPSVEKLMGRIALSFLSVSP